MRSIAAGKLRHQVNVLKPQTATTPGAQVDSLGQPINDWPVVYKNIWASIEGMSQREIFAAQQEQIEATIKITLRYRVMSATYVITFADPGTGTTRTFNVAGFVDPTGERVWVECLCNERGT